MRQLKIKLNNLTMTIGVLVVVLLYFLVLLGFTGMATIVGVLLFFVLPFYLIMRRWFGFGEAVFFSFFVGIGMFSALVYYIGFLTGIFLAIWIVFVVLVGLGVWLK